MSIKTILSSKGQVVIPKSLRNKLGLHIGSELIMHLRKDKIIELQPVQRNIEEFFGKGASIKKNEKIVNIDEAIAQTVLNNDKR